MVDSTRENIFVAGTEGTNHNFFIKEVRRTLQTRIIKMQMWIEEEEEEEEEEKEEEEDEEDEERPN